MRGFNGEFNLRTVGPEEFRQTMVTYFSQKGFDSTHVSREHRFIEWAAH
jgi:hypothetical protein